MAYYLVDYENVKADGMYGVDQLGKKDCVCIFYSENASTLTFGLHEKLNQTKGKIVLQKVEGGVKNALDFQLSTYLGYLISENEGKNETYYIVSEDKGLAILTGYWAERGENVKTASDIATAKEDLEEEIIEYYMIYTVWSKPESYGSRVILATADEAEARFRFHLIRTVSEIYFSGAAIAEHRDGIRISKGDAKLYYVMKTVQVENL